MKTAKGEHQANQYDKIFKENIEAVIPSLMKNILGIKVFSSEELPDDIQHTKERKPDVLKKITDVQGNTFVLQIEFQVVDEPEMVYRMGEYYLMLERKYKIPVEQYVIFIGGGIAKMPTELNRKRIKFNFSLISFSQLDYHIFLNSNKPEEIILGILANFKEESAKNAIAKIIHRVEETTEGDFSLKRYFQQLRILSQLRNLHIETEKSMESIAKYIDEDRDILVIRAKRKFVRNLLTKTEHTFEQIADIADVSIEFVESTKQQMSINE